MKFGFLLFFILAANAPAQRVEAEFTLTHTDPARNDSQGFRQGEIVGIRFKVRDKVSGEFLEGRSPFAWMDLRSDAEPGQPVSCKQVVQRLLNPDALSASRIDLNTYYVLVLNGDASLTVVDPRFDYGNARVLKLVTLPCVGEDWALKSGLRPILFVSLPLVGQVAMIDATTWQIVREIDLGPRASRVSLQPDGHYLWATYDAGIAAIETSTGSVAKRLQIEEGPHEIAFSSDRPLGFVTNQGGGSVSIIRTDRLELIRNVRTGPRPVSITFSSKGQAAYVSDAASGSVSVLDGSQNTPLSIKLEPGLGQMRFAGGGRYGFVLNGPHKLVHVIDSSTNRVVHTVATEHEPDQITFTSTLAYLRERGSGIVQMVPLDSMGKEISLAEFPAGQHPLDQATPPTPADSIVSVPGENSVMVADPKDRAVYYYSEGMAAPMGMFTNASREPRALLVVDHTLKQTTSGVYETTAWLERPGTYTVAFLLDSPQAVNCWDVAVEPDPALPQPHRRLKIERVPSDPVWAGASVAVRFRIRDRLTNAAQSGAADVSVLATLASWQQRKTAQALEDGVYEVQFVLPRAGTYYLHVRSPSLGLDPDTRPLTLQAVDREN